MDIQEFLYPPKKKWTPPPDDVRFSNLEDPIPDTEMPDYHEETLYQVSNGAKFSEGMSVLQQTTDQGSHKLWKSWKITKTSFMYGKIMEFEKNPE